MGGLKTICDTHLGLLRLINLQFNGIYQPDAGAGAVLTTLCFILRQILLTVLMSVN